MTERIIRVNAGGGYDICLKRGILHEAGRRIKEAAPAKRAAVVADSNVVPLYAAQVVKSLENEGIEAPLFEFEAGELSKSHPTLLRLYSFLAEKGITRSDIVVALGGGVTGDLAGFAAATFLRGIGLIQIPTTLLAQIDSSVGGKTGVDLAEGKNLVGAFHQPRLVLCDPDALKTLSARVLSDGMAEAVKYGCIRDEKLWEQIASFGGEENALDAIISRCVEIKRDIVERDEFDLGERMLLNFGHTLGHAVEKEGGYRAFTHGEAVSVGMVLAARAGEANGYTRAGTAEALVSVLRKFGLPVSCDYPMASLLKTAAGDKKRSGDEIRIVLLRKMGCGFTLKIPVSSLDRFFLRR